MCDQGGHNWIEVTSVEDTKRQYLCIITGQRQEGESLLPDIVDKYSKPPKQ